MPENFEKCIAEGGRVITIKPSKNTYQHICYDKNGKSHAGEVKKNKKKKK
jgi:hypothetical protein